MKRVISLSLLACSLAGLCGIISAQDTGLISGTVTDQSGAVIPDASITITNKTTGAARTITANTEGLYSAPSLIAGDYEVRVEVQGFRTVVRPATGRHPDDGEHFHDAGRYPGSGQRRGGHRSG